MEALLDYAWFANGQPRSFLNASPAQAAAAGVPADVIAAAAAGARLALVKAECSRRILAEASIFTQSNMHAVANVINSKPASARTDAEKAQLTAYASALGWIMAMRETCATLAADPNSPWQTDASWPEAPADAKAFVATL